jgi:hypothetical protein
VPKEDYWTDLDQDLPATTADFGADGYTASLSASNQLLQITAPHPTCGLVYARGNFPDNQDAILSRAQNEGSGSWGLRFSAKSQVRRGDVIDQGLMNFRWPFMSVDLVASENEVSVGTLFSCSCTLGLSTRYSA